MDTARKNEQSSEIPAICRSCEARHGGICGVLSPDQLKKLNRYTKQYSYESGNELLSAGEEAHRYSNILRGVVKLSKLLADGRQQIVGLQFAPDFMGRLFREESDVIADAATDVTLCTFPRNVIEELVRESPELEHKLHEQALKELDEAREWMLTLGRKTAGEKVASFLYLIAANVDPELADHDGPIRFELPLKRSDIADFLGLTIETVSRQITKLRKAGVIQIENNRTVIVPDLERLEAACETDR
ncbi:Crp/Fnr family transcriptional regulator [Oricola thermophila]|uniref:Crp/Fnr family transcriptional regulator n=1 Tax=Oricola thermophila TaxID=2742145 RepID=A0A6N1V992_9HYPH|nr:Crp/Fnr family transcriptional regulator [Oricola thermophila]QKV17490.1 Crp/Fnr family transcriptional regulator [Oricola thermophila]